MTTTIQCQQHECEQPATEYVEYDWWATDEDGRVSSGPAQLDLCDDHVYELRQEHDASTVLDGVHIGYRTHAGAER